MNRPDFFAPAAVSVAVNSASESQFYNSLADRLQQFSAGMYRQAERTVSTKSRLLGEQDAAAGSIQLKPGTSVEAQTYNQAAIEGYVASRRSDIRLTISGLEDQFPDNPEVLEAALKGAWDGQLKSPADPRLTEAVKPLFGDLATSAIIRARDRFLEKEDQNMKSAIDRDFEEMRGDALRFARDGNDEAAMRVLTEVRQRAAAGVRDRSEGGLGLLDPGVTRDFVMALEHDLRKASVVGGLQRLPRKDWGAYIKAIKDDPPEGWDASLQDEALREMMALTDRHDRIEALATAEQDAEQSRLVALAQSNLEIGVADGTKDEKDIEEAFQIGLISGPKRTELIKEKRRQLADAEVNAADIALVSAHIENAVPMDFQDKTQRNQVDAFYAAAQVDPYSADGRAQLALLVNRTQVVPTPVRSQVRALLRSGDVNQAVAAAGLLSDLVDGSPMVVDQLGETEKAVGLQVKNLVSAGTHPERAVELARQAVYEMAPSEREVRAERYREVSNGNMAALNEYVDADLDTWLSLQPQVTDALLGEFEHTTRSYYLLTGDEETARQAAWTDLQRVWGQTTINGHSELMKYPPEYAGVNREMFEAELEKAGIEASGIRVLSDAVTARDGSYPLFREVDGLPMPLLNERNVPARWTPERIRTADQEAAIAAARKQRAMRDNRRAKYLRGHR